jgi:pantetheine-phosphate adenylyltransferase
MSGKAVFPGTFDPVTLGHEHIVQRACRVFDEVIVAVNMRDKPSALLTAGERLDCARLCFASQPQVTVLPLETLLVTFLQQNNVKNIIRSIRQSTDFNYEIQMSFMNSELDPEVNTWCVMPALKFMPISGTLVREIWSLGGDVKPFVSASVKTYLNKRERS